MSSLILGIETSTKICSVAISQGNKLLALEEEGGAYSHAEKLTVFIKKVVKKSGIALQDLDAIAVSKGPGSYTGLRIGVATAKGLCYGLGKPLLSVSTLQAMAKDPSLIKSNNDPKLLLAPMIDARRMEVYTAIFDEHNNLIEDISAKIIDENSFSDYLTNHKIVFFGDGAQKCKTVLEGNKNAIFSNEGLPSSKYINQIALQQLIDNTTEDVAYFEPYYLKDFIPTTPKKLL